MSSRVGKRRRPGLLSEYVYFFKTYRMWWLLPIIGVVAVLGGLMILSGTKAGLMMYALF